MRGGCGRGRESGAGKAVWQGTLEEKQRRVEKKMLGETKKENQYHLQILITGTLGLHKVGGEVGGVGGQV